MTLKPEDVVAVHSSLMMDLDVVFPQSGCKAEMA